MEVGEGGADEFSDLEASVVGEEADLGRREGVVLSELKQAMIEPVAVLFLQVVEAEVEEEVSVALQED